MPRVFVSYSHADSAFVERLCTDLQIEHEVTVDRVSIVPDIPLIQQIAALIDTGQVFIPVISHASMRSAWVRRELSLAFDQSTRRGLSVVPVIIDDVEPISLIAHIPYVKFFTTDSPDYMNALTRLLSFLRRSPIISGHIVLECFSQWGNISVTHNGDYSVLIQSDGDTKGAAGLVYHRPLHITGFSKIIMHVGDSAASDFSGFYPRTSKMLKLQIDDLPILPSNGIAANVDDPGYVAACDGDIEYEIPATVRERGYLKKLEVVFGRGCINGLRFSGRVA